MKRIGNFLKRTDSFRSLCRSDQAPAEAYDLGSLRADRLPVDHDLPHPERPGALHRTREAPFWNVIDVASAMPNSDHFSARGNLASRLEYLGFNNAATKLEFGFQRVDEAAREALCQRFVALNRMMQEQESMAISFADGQTGVSWPQCFFHENHFHGDYGGGSNPDDHAKFHVAGLMHRDSTQLTHYYFHLG